MSLNVSLLLKSFLDSLELLNHRTRVGFLVGCITTAVISVFVDLIALSFLGKGVLGSLGTGMLAPIGVPLLVVSIVVGVWSLLFIFALKWTMYRDAVKGKMAPESAQKSNRNDL
jgi:hypothetical protein